MTYDIINYKMKYLHMKIPPNYKISGTNGGLSICFRDVS